VEKQAIVMVKT